MKQTLQFPHSITRAAAFLLPALPAAVATAAFAHGHGAMSAQLLALVVVAAIAAGTWLGNRLLDSSTSTERDASRAQH
ncbi:MAG: hypothetical protein C0434_05090 [Xanthomonadaceae bacterium]|nr:hypothetical protein [Xanthomonadaceae bacterium]